MVAVVVGVVVVAVGVAIAIPVVSTRNVTEMMTDLCSLRVGVSSDTVPVPVPAPPGDRDSGMSVRRDSDTVRTLITINRCSPNR